MTKTVALFLALLMTAVPLAGCTGDDTELNAANDRIGELETQAEADQASIAELETQAEADQASIAELETQAKADQASIAELEASLAELEGLCCSTADMDEFREEGYTEGYAAGLNDGYDSGWYDGNAAGIAEATPVSTLDTILARGSMKCGVKETQYGMGYLDAGTGVRSGLDIEYCRAIAAAIGLNPDTDIEWIPSTGSNRFDLLASGVIDVLIRTTTWTTWRDAELDADYAAVNFYDGQGIMVREDAYSAAAAGNSATGLDGANICVADGTTTQSNMVDWFSSRGIAFNTVDVDNGNDMRDKFRDGTCDAITGDMSAMVATKWLLDNDGSMNGVDIWIVQELLSKEPLASVTRDHDSEWNEIVSWVWYGMITAEEKGVTSGNYADMASNACAPNEWGGASDPSMCRLLAENLGLGTTDNPLADDWMQAVLGAVGNYGEAYDRAFCDGSYDGVSGSGAMIGCLVSRTGTANALVSEGGLQFAPPMR